MKEYLYGYDSEENSYLVSGYPWGFRLKTEQRYWIETNDKARGGQRFCIQTKNPKTGLWCKPKKSTYSAIEIMGLNEKDHVCTTGVDYNANGIDDKKGKEALEAFITRHRENLTDYQVRKLKDIKAYREVMESVSFKIEAKEPIECSKFFSTDEKDKAEIKTMIEEDKKHEKEQAEVFNNINRAINITASRIEL